MKGVPNAVTAEELKAIYRYDQETGDFFRIKTIGGQLPGKVTRLPSSSGYVQLMVAGRAVVAQRLAWLYVHGEMPQQQIDHINGNRLDNRIANLREVTQSQNMQNKRIYKNNKSGLPGVFWVRHLKKWNSCVQVDGVVHNLGFFSDKEEAGSAYLKAKAVLHPYANLERHK